MKVKSKVILVAIALVAVAAVFGSCSKKGCPAYSKVNIEQNQHNG